MSAVPLTQAAPPVPPPAPTSVPHVPDFTLEVTDLALPQQTLSDHPGQARPMGHEETESDFPVLVLTVSLLAIVLALLTRVWVARARHRADGW